MSKAQAQKRAGLSHCQVFNSRLPGLSPGAALWGWLWNTIMRPAHSPRREAFWALLEDEELAFVVLLAAEERYGVAERALWARRDKARALGGDAEAAERGEEALLCALAEDDSRRATLAWREAFGRRLRSRTETRRELTLWLDRMIARCEIMGEVDPREAADILRLARSRLAEALPRSVSG